MEKINIAELLKDCPSGMELDCTIWDSETKVFLKEVRNDDFTYPILVTIKDNNFEHSHSFTKYGAYNDYPYCKCVLFPKGKTTWEGFQRPFKDGDIIQTISASGAIAVFREQKDGNIYVYLSVYGNVIFTHKDDSEPLISAKSNIKTRLATEEEKNEFYAKLKKAGSKWNPETKSLEPILEPKFKVGDRIVHKDRNGKNQPIEVKSIVAGLYHLNGLSMSVECQDDWELANNKFDITTLKPFESRVLVRSTDDDIWRPAIYGFTDSDRYYVVGGIYWKQCIPYEGNEHLRGTTNDCDEYYKLVNHGRFRIVEN